MLEKKRKDHIGRYSIWFSGLVLTPALRYARGAYEHEDNFIDGANAECHELGPDACASSRANLLDLPSARKSWIDAEYSSDENTPKVVSLHFVLKA